MSVFSFLAAAGFEPKILEQLEMLCPYLGETCPYLEKTCPYLGNFICQITIFILHLGQ